MCKSVRKRRRHVNQPATRPTIAWPSSCNGLQATRNCDGGGGRRMVAKEGKMWVEGKVIRPGVWLENPTRQFLSRQTNWFNRVTSDKVSRSSISSNEPRSSTSSSGRKHKISHPTDPQPNPCRPAEDERASSSRSQAAKHRRVSPMSPRASTMDDPHASSNV
ncbi:uncharacterized protein C8Q71DRAFT_721357 [Rhodofomes roseus]|uniref:Uncharacterized protein n=1 Tax=Rhodofomes roseus TaxID=34475 RepID=A0ABQ8KQW2_9APHY|nr:uncharacterized protein C8Q71DRAFT_721357 [Rhodofomes roseus]KAH9840920.1 hypothetical protein C8Q71DRAFT_721357 [Rhodofomes roseus]